MLLGVLETLGVVTVLLDVTVLLPVTVFGFVAVAELLGGGGGKQLEVVDPGVELVGPGVELVVPGVELVGVFESPGSGIGVSGLNDGV